jgi:hypothetical protein
MGSIVMSDVILGRLIGAQDLGQCNHDETSISRWKLRTNGVPNKAHYDGAMDTCQSRGYCQLQQFMGWYFHKSLI